MKKLDRFNVLPSAWKLYLRLFSYIRMYWVALLIGAIASIAYSGIDAWFIYFLKPLLNKGLIHRDHHFLVLAPFLVLIIFISRGLAGFLSNYYISSASRHVIARLREDLFIHLQKLPANYYDYTTSGSVLSILLYAVDQVSNASADILTMAFQSLCLMIGLIVVMISISWKLTLLYFFIIPLIMIVMRVASLRVRRLSLATQQSVAALGHCAEENIEGYKVVRTFSGEAQEIEKFSKAVKTNRQCEMKMVVTRSLTAVLVQCITAAAFALTLYIATLEVAQSILSPGGFVSICTAMLALLKPMKDLALVQNKLHRGLAGAQTVFALLDEAPEIDDAKKDETPYLRVKGKIKFSNVNFSYPKGRGGVHDISFVIEPGEIVAFVGRSGSGKSTLMNLLLRFYREESGLICIDDVAIDHYPLYALRKQFSLVSQQVTLFHDTIANNIAYGQKQATEEAILAAAEAAYAMEFIKELPEQLNTVIGENGVLLSGGQRQRLAIARAILKNAPILILDEATSSLDTESERYIQAALQQFMQHRTTLIIAHRLSTIEHADKIIVMSQGRLVESGHHTTLLALNGQYAQLHCLQFKDPA